MSAGSHVLPGSLLFSQGGQNRQKVFGFLLSTGKKIYKVYIILMSVIALIMTVMSIFRALVGLA